MTKQEMGAPGGVQEAGSAVAAGSQVRGFRAVPPLRCIVLVFAGCFIWTWAIPAGISLRKHTAFSNDVEAVLERSCGSANSRPPSWCTDQAKRLINQSRLKKAYELCKESLSQELSSELNAALNANNVQEAWAKAAPLRQALDGCAKQATEAQGPGAVIGFFDSGTSYIYFVSYLALLLHLFLSKGPPAIGPELKGSIVITCKWGRRVALACSLYALWGINNLVRNFMSSDPRRTIFSALHFQIDCADFFLQELRTFGLCALFTISWEIWSSRSATLPWPDPPSLAELKNAPEWAGNAFRQWELHSVILAAVFVPWTMFYWHMTQRYGDSRYYWSALMVHLYWAITWFLVSKPASSTLREYDRLRKNVAFRASFSEALKRETEGATESSRGEPATLEGAARMLEEFKPVSRVKAVFVVVAATVTFFGPAFRLLGK